MAVTDPLERHQQLALMRELAQGENGLRNLCMWTLGVAAGYRVQEMLNLQRKDVLGADGEVVRKLSIKPGKRKGNNLRTEGIGEGAREILRDHLLNMEKWGRRGRNDWVFSTKTGKRPLHRCSAWAVVKRASVLAGLTGINVACHSWRKTYLLELYNELKEKYPDHQIYVILRDKIGHMDINTTLKYTPFLREGDTDNAKRNIDGWLTEAVNEAKRVVNSFRK